MALQWHSENLGTRYGWVRRESKRSRREFHGSLMMLFQKRSGDGDDQGRVTFEDEAKALTGASGHSGDLLIMTKLGAIEYNGVT